MHNDLVASIKELAKKHGFDDLSFTRPLLPSASLSYYNHLVENELFGDMHYLSRNSFLRQNPLSFVPNAKSVIVLAVNYFNNYSKSTDLTVSKYALLSEDYHIWFKKALKLFANELSIKHSCDSSVFIDTSPIMEKVLASFSSLGWQGKHSCLVSRKFGSWLFLGFVFTDLNIVSYDIHKNYCGKCTACIKSCPTGAIKNYKLDIQKCIAYYNIEHKGFIPAEIALKMGKRLFGCDDCLNACIWNKFAKEAKSKLVSCNNALSKITLKQVLLMQEREFLEIFNKTPIKRLTLPLLKRNAIIVALNTNNKKGMEIIKNFINSDNKIVKETAKWALQIYNSRITRAIQ